MVTSMLADYKEVRFADYSCSCACLIMILGWLVTNVEKCRRDQHHGQSRLWVGRCIILSLLLFR